MPLALFMTLKDEVAKLIDVVSESTKIQTVQVEILETVRKTVDKIDGHISGTDNKDGLLIRVDRMEIGDKRRNRILWLLGGGIIFVIVGWIKGFL